MVSTTTTCPQYSITVTGYGFPANTSIALLLNGTTLQTTTTNSSGTFTITITAPQTPGTYTLTTNVTYMGYPTPVTINVTPPYVQVNGQSSVSGIVGGTVTVSGACFPPTKPVNLYINNVEYPSVTTTSSQGSFSVNVDLPLLPPGTYTVYAEVNNIHSVVNASVTILQPQIVSVTPTAGGEGSCFVIKGINFANATLYSIAVTINGATYTYGEYSEYVNRSSVANAFGVSCSQSVTLYANGTVILPVIVPVTTPGPYTVYVNSTVHSSLISPTGVPSTTPEEIVPSTITAPNDTLYATTSFTVQPSYITVTPTQVVGGQQILITGYNFYPGSPVTIIVNGTNVTSVIVGSNGQFSATYTVPSYLTSGVLYIVAEENYTSYIAGTPPNAVGNATATVKIVNFYIAVLDDLTKLLQCCSSVNATLQQLMSKVEGVASEVSTVYSTVLSMNSTLTSISSTLSSISSTLSSMQSTLTSIQGMLSSISNTLTTIQGILTADFSTVISDLSSMQSTLSTINSNVLSVNSTVTYYAQQLLSGISNIQSMIQGLQTTLSSQYSTIEGQLGAIGSGWLVLIIPLRTTEATY
ncbi:hypothetical protein [Vulcanisaeta sp. JCM 16161]|uniref:hypothetical protein n=1 Tax=Vulcanisaeta sp. JCM 16161 TaxID=1295372 RepID=UPI0006D0CFEE|nr:hypothetical protein [Vulcanisaeta sp. JCM 16161]